MVVECLLQGLIIYQINCRQRRLVLAHLPCHRQSATVVVAFLSALAYSWYVLTTLPTVVGIWWKQVLKYRLPGTNKRRILTDMYVKYLDGM